MGQAREREGEEAAGRLTGQAWTRSSPHGLPRKRQGEGGRARPDRTAHGGREAPANGGEPE